MLSAQRSKTGRGLVFVERAPRFNNCYNARATGTQIPISSVIALESVVRLFIKGSTAERSGRSTPDPGPERRQCANEELAPTFIARRSHAGRCFRSAHLGTLGLSLPAALRAEAQSGLKVRAKSVIFLHQFGGLPQQDTFDMKPNAPAELRGEFKPIASSLPGLSVCELLPRLSQIMHNFTVVRSVNHRIGAHNSATYYSLTGHTPQVDIVSATASASDFPAYGSVVSKLAPSTMRVPTFVSLPWMIADGVFRTPGQFAGYLGKEHDPLFITKDPNARNFSVEELTLPIEVPLERVSTRRALRSGLAAYAQLNESIAAVRGLDVLPAEGALALDLVRDAAGLRHRGRRSPAPRPLRPHALRPERAHGSAAGRGRRAVRDGLLLARHQRLGHAQRQLQHPSREAPARPPNRPCRP